jgi:hypothetical protein
MTAVTSGFDHERFVKVADKVVCAILRVFGEMPNMHEREGASFCVIDQDGVPVITVRIGYVQRRRKRKYHDLSVENARRLTSFQNVGHLTSRESADPEHDRFPGAVCGISYNYSVSGFTADIDELGAAAASFVMVDYNEEAIKRVQEANPLASLYLTLLMTIAAIDRERV